MCWDRQHHQRSRTQSPSDRKGPKRDRPVSGTFDIAHGFNLVSTVGGECIHEQALEGRKKASEGKQDFFRP